MTKKANRENAKYADYRGGILPVVNRTPHTTNMQDFKSYQTQFTPD